MQTLPQTFEFPVYQDQFISVNKTELVQALFNEFKVKMTPDDIRILKDGTELMLVFGAQNTIMPEGTFKKIADFFTSEVVNDIKYDTEVLKIWIEPTPELLFMDSEDAKLHIVPAGVDAPAGTIQVSVEENKVYTLLYSREDKIGDAIQEALSLVGKQISTKPMVRDRQVDDQRVSIIRKKYGQHGKGYNDRVNFKHPVINKIIVHV